MIFPSNRARVMVATKPLDFRKGHDGLAAPVKNELHKDPFTGTVFVFRSRKADRLKLIYWDGSGLAMAYNLSRPPEPPVEDCCAAWFAPRGSVQGLSRRRFPLSYARNLAFCICTAMSSLN